MSTLRDEIRQVESKTFTLDEICSHIPNSKCVHYTDLKKFRSLPSLMAGKKKLLILLDPPELDVGHFVLLIVKSSNYVCFFDPYGNTINTLLTKYFTTLDDSLPRLLKGYNVDENIYKLQKTSNAIQTCGRWCIVRGLKHQLDNREFKNFFRFGSVPLDELVTLMTEAFLDYKI